MFSFKKILVALDFSDCAINALKVAISICKQTGGSITILNSFNDPIVYGGSSLGNSEGLLIETKEEVVKEFEALEHLLPALDEVEHEFVLSPYGVEEAIHYHAKKHKHDLVVMGTRGASGLKGMLFGSHTYSVTQHIECPMLTIPELSATDMPMDKIVLATDLNEEEAMTVFEPLKAIVELYKAELHLLHIAVEPVLSSIKTDSAWELDNYFKESKHSFHFRFDEPVEDALLNYIEEKGINLVAVVKRKRAILDGLFHKSLTRKLSFHSSTPLLVLQDDQTDCFLME